MDYFFSFNDKDILPSQKRKRRLILLIVGGVILLTIIIIIIVAASSSPASKNSSEINREEEPDDDGPVPDTPWGKYLAVRKYLYVWEYPKFENFFKFVQDHNFKRVYLYVGCLEWDYDNLIKGNLHSPGDEDAKIVIQKLLDKGIEVEPTIYLNDSPNNFANVENMPNIAKGMAELQKTLKFKALHFDVEPSSRGNYEALLKMYENCRKYLKVSAILKPAWLNQKMSELEEKFTDKSYFNKFKDCETYIDALMMVTDYSDLMAYNCEYSTVNTMLDKYKVIKARHPDHIAKPVLEMDRKAGNDSTYARYFEDKDTFFNWFYQVSKDFGGVTIHQYKAWNEDLYCEKPTKDSTYYFGQPKKCSS